jgi:hypothetical protein
MVFQCDFNCDGDYVIIPMLYIGAIYSLDYIITIIVEIIFKNDHGNIWAYMDFKKLP